jgi:hypothetical protein
MQVKNAKASSNPTLEEIRNALKTLVQHHPEFFVNDSAIGGVPDYIASSNVLKAVICSDVANLAQAEQTHKFGRVLATDLRAEIDRKRAQKYP